MPPLVWPPTSGDSDSALPSGEIVGEGLATVAWSNGEGVSSARAESEILLQDPPLQIAIPGALHGSNGLPEIIRSSI